tara:strand:- start:7273 stop:7680 length:408 start_codon:yes stop_codon:yes gene_type:complete
MKTESIGYWDLPQPDIKGYTDQWLPIPKMARTIPFGYVEDPDDSTILRPIKNELDALEKAKRYLGQYSYREIANWLSKQTGRYISHVGLRKRVQDERRRKKTASVKRQYAKRYEEIIKAAEKIETERVGASKTTD